MIFTFCLGLLYNLSLIFYPVKISVGQHQWQDNCIKAQEYLFHKKKYNNVIIGSSMSTRIQTSTLQESYFNLSFGGLSVYDGFNVLKLSQILPDTLFVEMNILFRMPDENFKMNQKNRFFLNVCKNILIFQEKYQPSVYIANYFIEFIKDFPHLKPYRTEWVVYYEDIKLAGSIDMVYENPCYKRKNKLTLRNIHKK